MEQNQEQNIAEIKIEIFENKKESCKICGVSLLKNDIYNCELCLLTNDEYSFKKIFRSNIGALIPIFILPAFGIDISQIICVSFGVAALLEFIV